MQKCLNIDRKNRFLPKGIYLYDQKGKYPQFRACIKINGKTKTIAYDYNLLVVCQALIIVHEQHYGKKPHWYKEFKEFYKKQSNPLEF
jgi:hypothetical protein